VEGREGVLTPNEERLLQDLRDPKWSRFKETGALAAHLIEELKNENRYWREMWEHTANRLLQIDPVVNSRNATVVERIRRLEGVIENEKKRTPNPWTDV
jgi:hypothetical protein